LKGIVPRFTAKWQRGAPVCDWATIEEAYRRRDQPGILDLLNRNLPVKVGPWVLQGVVVVLDGDEREVLLGSSISTHVNLSHVDAEPFHLHIQ